MVDHPNSFLVHQCLQAVSSGDTETLRALWAEDITWHVKGASPWHGELVGPDSIFEYLAQLGDIGPHGYQIDVDDIMIGEERVSLVFSVKAELGGREFDSSYILLARVAGRRIQEIVAVPVEADRVAAFWEGYVEPQVQAS